MAHIRLQEDYPGIRGLMMHLPESKAAHELADILLHQPGSFTQAERELRSRAFRRQARQFGNTGGNMARGPAFRDRGASLVRNFHLTETGLEFRAESLNIADHGNLGRLVADVNSPNVAQILTAGAPRPMQFACKLIF